MWCFYLETLQYYRQAGSHVYSCLLDASKAFDRIHYGKLFNDLMNDTEHVLLCQNKINWVDSFKHLGYYFNTQLSDSTDCMMKRSTFIGSVNRLMANSYFGHLQAPV